MWYTALAMWFLSALSYCVCPVPPAQRHEDYLLSGQTFGLLVGLAIAFVTEIKFSGLPTYEAARPSPPPREPLAVNTAWIAPDKESAERLPFPERIQLAPTASAAAAAAVARLGRVA